MIYQTTLIKNKKDLHIPLFLLTYAIYTAHE